MSAVQDALIQFMVIAATSDAAITDQELGRIEGLIVRLPIFEGFDRSRLADVVNATVDKLNGEHGFEGMLDQAMAAIPPKLEDTAYALAVEITAVDLNLEQEELRVLEMMRDRMDLDRLTTAAIEVAARARHRRLPAQ